MAVLRLQRIEAYNKEQVLKKMDEDNKKMQELAEVTNCSQICRAHTTQNVTVCMRLGLYLSLTHTHTIVIGNIPSKRSSIGPVDMVARCTQ